MRVLIVDDSRAMRSIIGRIMKELKWEVLEAGNGREALEALAKSGRADLVLVDWNMPVMDGLEFVKAARADVAYATVPIMMVTTENDQARVSLALEAGANEYVMKPFDREMILSKLEMLGIQAP